VPVYFVFADDALDDEAHPNKLLMPRAQAAASEFTSLVKNIFFPGQDVAITLTFNMAGSRLELPGESATAIPMDNRANVIRVHAAFQEDASKVTTQAILLAAWLQSNNLGHLAEPLVQHRVTIDLLQYLKETDLAAMGIHDWGTRIALLEAIQSRM